MTAISFVTDAEITAIPSGIAAKAVADYLGVSVQRVEAARKRHFIMHGRVEGRRINDDDAISGIENQREWEAMVSKGSMDLLRAQLAAHQHEYVIGQEAEYTRVAESVGLVVREKRGAMAA
jgi:hypothetical protein